MSFRNGIGGLRNTCRADNWLLMHALAGRIAIGMGIIMATACQHRSADPSARGAPPTTQATWHQFQRTGSGSNGPLGVWVIEIRTDEIREIAGEVAWKMCVDGLHAGSASCGFPIDDGVSITVSRPATSPPHRPPLAEFDLARVCAGYRDSGRLLLYRDSDGAHSEVDLTAEPGTSIRKGQGLGPQPPHWSFPVFADGGTFLRASLHHVDGFSEPTLGFAMLPDELPACVGELAETRCQEELSKGWSECSFPIKSGFLLHVGSAYSPTLDVSPRTIGGRFRTSPRLLLVDAEGVRNEVTPGEAQPER